MKKKVIIIISTIILGIFIGISIFLLTNKNEKTVFIPEVSFTLNDIKNRFLASPYATENKCKGSIKNNSIIIKCDQKYTFTLEESDLVLEVNNEKDTEIFKYMVDSIETFYKADYTDYYETMDKFLAKELSINNLYYYKEDNIKLKVNLLGILDKYVKKEQLTKETIKDKYDTNYEYSELGYKINNIEFIYNKDLNWLTFAGTLVGNDHNIKVNIKLYSQDNKVLYEYKEDLNEITDQGFAYYNFGINIDLTKININYNEISSYSISLQK